MVNKKQKNILITGIIVIIGLIFIINSGGIRPFAIPVCSGGQVLSVDSITLTGSSPLNSDNVIRVLFSTNPTGECLDILIDESDLENSIPNFDASGNVLGNIDLTKSDKVYDINLNSPTQNFNAFGYKDIGFEFFCTINTCESDPGVPPGVFSAFKTSASHCHCFWDENYGKGGDFASSSLLEWETEVSLSGIGNAVLDNSHTSKFIGNKAFVKWAGNLDAPASLDSIDKDAFFPVGLPGSEFRMIGTGTFGNFYTFEYGNLRDGLVSCGSIGGGSICNDDVSDAISFNTEVQNSVENQLSTWVSQESWVDSAEISNDKLIAHLGTPVSYPIFTLDIDAEEVGVFITGGDPEVTCPSDVTIPEGQLSILRNYQIQNIGDQSGAFSYSLDCDDASTVVTPQPNQNIGSGQTLNVQAEMTLIVPHGEDPETVECTFIATDVNNQNTDSCSLELTALPQPIDCGVPGNELCQGGDLWTCLEDGTWDVTQCQFGCTTSGGNPECLLEPSGEICGDGVDNDGDGLIDNADPDCASGNGCSWWNIPCLLSGIGVFGFFTLLKSIIVLTTGFLTIFLSRTQLDKIGALRRKPAIAWGFAIFLGLAVGTLLFAFLSNPILFFGTFFAVILYFAITKRFKFLKIGGKRR